MDFCCSGWLHSHHSSLDYSRFPLGRILLDFVDLPAEHTGENLKNSKMEVQRGFEIAHKTLGYTVGGAASMELFTRVMLPEIRTKREKHGVKTDGKLYTVTQHVLLSDFLVFTGVFFQFLNSECGVFATSSIWSSRSA